MRPVARQERHLRGGRGIDAPIRDIKTSAITTTTTIQNTVPMPRLPSLDTPRKCKQRTPVDNV